ncbi:MAG: sensor histidine kinase [Sphingomonadales bacterium]|nr:sensor histidine kinase [Sphingomonadales bacterium]
MYRLARYDVARRFGAPRTRFLARIGFGLLCSAAMLALILIVRLWTPVSGPFLFLFPTVVIATLYGKWPAGLTAMLTGLAATGYFILPGSPPLSFAQSSFASRIATACLVSSVLLLLAEYFRRTAERHVADRDREVERGKMLLRELEHRTRNNFALVASLLDFQRRQSTDPEVRRALDLAIGRVHTFADAYSQLGSTQTGTSDVDMQHYLTRLLERVANALFDDEIQVETEIAAMMLPSRKAVAIGLYLNEALTNCAKYAFPDGCGGTIRIALAGVEGGGWRLTVLDDGVGEGQPTESGNGTSSGLGGMLFEALAAQAGASHRVTLAEGGRRLDLVSMS